MATGWLWEERYAWHDAGIWNDSAATPANAYAQPERAFENPETKRRFRNLLDVTGVLDKLVQLRARPATDEEILRVHTPEHLAHIRAVAASGGDLDGTETHYPLLGGRREAGPTARCTPAKTSVSTAAW